MNIESNPLLKIENLTRRYSKKSRGVDGLNFDIQAGQRVALLGLNGAGKSTTFKLISGLLYPEAGRVLFDGDDMAKQPELTRKKMGYLSEDIPLCKELTVKEHLHFQTTHYGVSEEKLPYLIDACELGDVLQKPIGNLSRGFRQRVALAGTIAHAPKLILLDEPTAGLDPHQIEQFRQLIKTVATDCSILLSTHILSEAEVMCDRCLVLHEGKLLSDVIMPSRTYQTWKLVCSVQGAEPPASWKKLGNSNGLEGMIYNRVLDQQSSPDELEKLIQQKVKVISYSPHANSLESLFLKITSGRLS